MKNKNSISLLVAASLFAALFITSCVKHEIVEPPIGGEIVTNIVANTTIGEIKAAHVAGTFDSIKLDKIIKATVIADDRSGNFYKSLFVQDETGGLELLLNVGSLYTYYPIGRVVYVKLQGLIVGDYQGTTQVGGYIFDNTLGGIEPAEVTRKVLKGELNKPVTPKEISISQIKPADYATLVTLKDVQFTAAEVGLFYADYIGKSTTNRKLEDCNGKTITLRSSGYANFAPQQTPGGKGTVTGVLSAFGTTPQIYIRNISDVKLDSARCGSGNGGGNPFDVDFEDQALGAPVNIAGWVNFSPISGGRKWGVKEFSNNSFAEIEAYQDTKPTTESWLVSKVFSTTAGAKTLSFQSSVAYWKHNGFEVKYSTNFNGTDPTSATWTNLSPTLPGSGSTNFVFVDSGNLTIPAGSATVWVAFRYTGVAGSLTTKVQLDNIKIQ